MFGTSVSSAGDVDLDGIADVLVGSMLNDGLGPIDAGSARVHAGGTGTALFTMFGEAAGDLFGCAVAGIGDVDADGHSDILVGARSNDAGGLDAGRAYVFSGASHVLLGTLTGSASDHLGWSVAKTGDVNRDGDADVLVGALFDVVGGSQVGSATVSTVMCGQSSTYGAGCLGTGGFVPSFDVVGCASPLGTLTSSISGALPGVGLIFIGGGPAQIPMSTGCSLLAFPVLPQPLSLPLFGFGPGGGSISVAAKVPPVATPVSFAMQAFVADPAGTGGFANSNGVLVDLE
ncbi:MAG: VCBS repeat-containing protein [Planctomycetes bacterium]|nr:VCBS repeat-containing protein [Planctomycetota bacterium]